MQALAVHVGHLLVATHWIGIIKRIVKDMCRVGETASWAAILVNNQMQRVWSLVHEMRLCARQWTEDKERRIKARKGLQHLPIHVRGGWNGYIINMRAEIADTRMKRHVRVD